jgi:hypothetical protein
MKVISLVEIRYDQLEIEKRIEPMVAIALLCQSIVNDELLQSIEYQFEFPIVYMKNEKYYAIANFLSLVSKRCKQHDRIYVLVVKYEPRQLKKIAIQYVRHILTWQTNPNRLYPLIIGAMSVGKYSKSSQQNVLSSSQRDLEKILNLTRQNIRTLAKNSVG